MAGERSRSREHRGGWTPRGFFQPCSPADQEGLEVIDLALRDRWQGPVLEALRPLRTARAPVRAFLETLGAARILEHPELAAALAELEARGLRISVGFSPGAGAVAVSHFDSDAESSVRINDVLLSERHVDPMLRCLAVEIAIAHELFDTAFTWAQAEAWSNVDDGRFPVRYRAPLEALLAEIREAHPALCLRMVREDIARHRTEGFFRDWREGRFAARAAFDALMARPEHDPERAALVDELWHRITKHRILDYLRECRTYERHLDVYGWARGPMPFVRSRAMERWHREILAATRPSAARERLIEQNLVASAYVTPEALAAFRPFRRAFDAAT